MALTITHDGQQATSSPWATDYASYNYLAYNYFFKVPPEYRDPRLTELHPPNACARSSWDAPPSVGGRGGAATVSCVALHREVPAPTC